MVLLVKYHCIRSTGSNYSAAGERRLDAHKGNFRFADVFVAERERIVSIFFSSTVIVSRGKMFGNSGVAGSGIEVKRDEARGYVCTLAIRLERVLGE